MTRVLLLFLLVLLTLPGTSQPAHAQTQPPGYQWVVGAYGNSTGAAIVFANGTALSPDGSVYSAYEHRNGNLLLGNQTFVSRGMSVVKYDAQGHLLNRLIWCSNARIGAMTTDAAGAFYVLGQFADTLYLRGHAALPQPVTGHHFFVAKWTSAGTLAWVKQGFTNGNAPLLPYNDCIGVDAAGRVSIASSVDAPAGTIHTLTFGSSTITTKGLFVAQFDANGNVNWLKSPSTTTSSYPTGFAVDPLSGAIVLAGQLNASSPVLRWGTHLVAPQSTIWFWLRLDANGNYLTSFASSQGCGIRGPMVGMGENGYSYLAIPLFRGTNTSYNIHGASASLPTGWGSATIVARLDPNGIPQWVRALTQVGGGINTQYLTSAPAGVAWRGSCLGQTPCYLGGYYYTAPGAPWQIDGVTLPVVPGGSGADVSALLALDELTGRVLWALPGGSGGTRSEFRAVSAQASGELAVIGHCEGWSFNFGNLPLTFVPNAAPNSKSFTAKILQSHNTISGRMYLDINNNNSFDAGTDQPRASSILTVQPGNQWATTAPATGLYTALVGGPGTYTVSPPPAPLYHSVQATGDTSATFTGFGGVAPDLDFAVHALPNQQDLRVSITPVTRARAGFFVRYHMQYRNVGTTSMPGDSITITLDSLFTYLSNTGGASLRGHTLTATYGPLDPDQEGGFDITCQLPTSARVGRVLVTTATIYPTSGDLTPTDNTETSHLTITGSFDPNNIEVNWPILTPQQVSSGEWLEYIIRFQNLGNDTAFSVLLRDSLPLARLNLSTLSLVAASHSCTWTVRPGGLLAVQFANIQLPHLGINTIGSLGFVRFKVRPNTSLVSGDLIPNRADIHFDFNVPVTTNTATTQVSNPSGLHNPAFDVLPGSVWPNPVQGTLHVETTPAAPGTLTLRLLDITGRAVLEHRSMAPAGNNRQSLDLHTLPAGLYLLQAEAGGRHFTRRIIVP